jgi:ParB family chromosome partitioning protein
MSTKSRIASKTDALLASMTSEAQSSNTSNAPVTPAESRPGKTGPGQMLIFNGLIKEADEKVKKLESKLAKFDGAEVARKLDPATIRASKWANRLEDSFQGKAWDDFKEEISNAGGNVQPIKVRTVRLSDSQIKPVNENGVRPSDTLPQGYEIIFGHRRHRACLELGLDVLVLIEELSDAELFVQMDRENRQRANLTAYEQGEMYRHALDDGLYPSIRKLSESLGIGMGNAADSVKIARLPVQLLDAFESRLDIQFRWAAPLAEALQKDPDVILAIAKAIKAERDSGVAVKSTEVYKRLVSKGADSAYTPSEVTGKSGCKSQITFNPKKKIFSISIEGLDAGKLKAIEKLLKEL